VPVPHFGVALTVDAFQELSEIVVAKGVKFVVEPHLRFVGRKGEQWTMFFKDPSGNNLEFKAMTTPENLFAKYVEE
jgi:extradiol dioxygenase family protein